MGTGRHIDELAPMPVSPVGSVVRRHGICFHVNTSPCFDGAEFLGYPLAWTFRGWERINEGYDVIVDCMFRHYRRVWFLCDDHAIFENYRPLITMAAWEEFRARRDEMWWYAEEPLRT